MNQHLGIFGKKLGMTQYFADDGNVVRCTVVDITGLTVVGKRTIEKDGYSAVIFGLGERTEKHTNKPLAGGYKKAGVSPKKELREMRLPAADVAKYEVGATVKVEEIFEAGQFVDTQGRTRGRGFTGVMRRWSFAGGTGSHGTHEYFRHGGSIGTNMTPGRTLPGLKMPGHYGDEIVTVHNLKVAKLVPEENLLLIEGGIPGSRNSIVTVRGAVKKRGGKAKK